MMTLQEILTYRGAYKVVPVVDEMYADVRTPMEVFRIVRNISSHCYILESMEDSHNRGRYTFIGYDPQLGISCRDGQVQIRTGTTVSIKTTRPQDLIQPRNRRCIFLRKMMKVFPIWNSCFLIRSLCLII